jgi:hypothetical protein
MHAQLIFFDETPDQVDAGIRHVTDEVIAPLEGTEGLAGWWLVDREAGQRISVMIWDSDEAMQAGFAKLGAFRESIGNPDRPTPSKVQRFEIYGSI